MSNLTVTDKITEIISDQIIIPDLPSDFGNGTIIKYEVHDNLLLMGMREWGYKIYRISKDNPKDRDLKLDL